MDEYVGLPADHPESYRTFMHENFFNHIDIQPENYFGITLHSEFEKIGERSIEINGKVHKAVHFIEKVSIPNLDQSFQNDFWIDIKTQRVIASEQTLGPLLPRIELLELKPFYQEINL